MARHIHGHTEESLLAEGFITDIESQEINDMSGYGKQEERAIRKFRCSKTSWDGTGPSSVELLPL